MPKLTDSQRRAVNLRGDNIIVSASAGTGKTHAMISRVTELVLGQREEKGVVIEDADKRIPVKRILLMTYTKAAAAEMKGRLQDFLTEELKNTEDKERADYLIEQLDDLPSVDISTIHAFAAAKLRRYFQELEINPLFDVADDEDKKAYIAAAMTATMDALGEDESLKQLRELLASDMRNDKLEDLILKIYYYIYSLDNPEEWLKKVSLSQYEEDFKDSEIIRRFIVRVNKEAIRIIDKAISAVTIAEENGAGEYALWLMEIIKGLSLYSKAKSYDDLKTAYKKILPLGVPNAGKKEIKSKCSYVNKLTKNFFESIPTYIADENTIQRHLNGVKDTVNCFIGVVKAFSRNFDIIKERENKLTFTDLEQLTAKLLRDDRIREEISNEYDYVLVDEYQDVNYLQEFIISRLAKGDNLFMVGDSKQSIYRFRQAVPEIFIRRNEEYLAGRGGVSESFNMNFRSRKSILDFVNSIFSVAMSREFGGVDYIKSAMLTTEPDDDAPYRIVNEYPAVSILTYKIRKREHTLKCGVYSVIEGELDEDSTAAEDEAKIIHMAIRELLDTPYYDRKSGNKKIIEVSDIAILCRNRNGHTAAVLNKLTEYGLPLNNSNVKEDSDPPEVKLLINFLQVLDNFRQDIPLIALMRSYIGDFTDGELLKIRKEGNALVNKQKNKKIFFYELLPIIKNPELAQKIKRFKSFIERYRIKSGYTPVFQLLGELISETGYDHYLLQDNLGDKRLKVIRDFVYSLKDKPYAASVSRFLYHYCNYSSTPNKPEEGEASDGITVTTMHGSKGLEYPVVILINAGGTMNIKSSPWVADKELGLAFEYYDSVKRIKSGNLALDVMNDIRKGKEREDELNLLYVALTRAKNHLIITGSEKKDGLSCAEPPWDAKCLLDWIAIGSNHAKYELYEVDALDSYNPLSERIEKRKIAYFSDNVDPIYTEAIRKRLDFIYPYKESTEKGIKYTVSAINKSDPGGEAVISSLYDPDGREKGTMTHKVLEHIDLRFRTAAGIQSEIERLKSEEIIRPEDERLIDLDEIYDCLNSPIMVYASENDALREKEFLLRAPAREVLPDSGCDDEVLIQGTIDMLIIGAKNVIVDYKRTGIKEEKEIIARYGRQLNLYAIAAERIMGIKIHRKVIYLIGRNKEIEVE